MTAQLWKAPTSNFWSTSLNGAINNSVNTITLNSTSGLQAPGFLIINREDNSGNATPTAREIVSFTGISGNDITGVTRAADNSTARSHSDGALVEAVLTVGMWNDTRDALNAEHDTDGTHTIIGSATITTANIVNLSGSNASIATLNAGTFEATNLRGVSGSFDWAYSGALATSLTTAERKPYWRATKNMTLTGVWAGLASAPSLAPVKLDIEYSTTPAGTFASIFSVKPLLGVGFTNLTSSATGGTLSLTSLASGTILQPEIEEPDTAGILTLQLIGKERA